MRCVCTVECVVWVYTMVWCHAPMYTHAVMFVQKTQFFQLYTGLLRSDNFVTRRQSLKVRCCVCACVYIVSVRGCPLFSPREVGGYTSVAHSMHHMNQPIPPYPQLLGELLLNRANVQIMMRYVADVNNLMLMMNLLKDGSRSIQYEAFHVFKVCVLYGESNNMLERIDMVCDVYCVCESTTLTFFCVAHRSLWPTRKSPRPLSTFWRSTRRSWSSISATFILIEVGDGDGCWILYKQQAPPLKNIPSP